jgi:hypothetical protein
MKLRLVKVRVERNNCANGTRDWLKKVRLCAMGSSSTGAGSTAPLRNAPGTSQVPPTAEG